MIIEEIKLQNWERSNSKVWQTMFCNWKATFLNSANVECGSQQLSRVLLASPLKEFAQKLPFWGDNLKQKKTVMKGYQQKNKFQKNFEVSKDEHQNCAKLGIFKFPLSNNLVYPYLKVWKKRVLEIVVSSFPIVYEPKPRKRQNHSYKKEIFTFGETTYPELLQCQKQIPTVSEELSWKSCFTESTQSFAVWSDMLKHRTPRYVDLVSPSIWEYRLNDKTIIDVIYDQKFPEIQLFTSNSIFFRESFSTFLINQTSKIYIFCK